MLCHPYILVDCESLTPTQGATQQSVDCESLTPTQGATQQSVDCELALPRASHGPRERRAMTLNRAHMCWGENALFPATFDSPQGHLGHCWVILWEPWGCVQSHGEPCSTR